MTRDHDLPRVRALALGAVVLVVTAAGAVAGDARPVVLAVTAVVLGLGAAWRWRAAGRTGLSSSAAVAAVLVAVLLLDEGIDDVDVLLAATGVVALVAAWLLRERRLAVSGLLSFGALLGRPVPGGEVFHHCLVATDVGVPVPRLDGPLLLAVGALALGSLLRWTGWADRRGRGSVARGVEMTGAVGVGALLLAKAVELPGHPLLCGAGDAVDVSWWGAGVAFAVVAGAYGLAARDLVWEALGLALLVLLGLAATTLTGQWGWAAGCGLALVGALAVADRLGVPWPDAPGYEHARPRARDLLDRMSR